MANIRGISHDLRTLGDNVTAHAQLVKGAYSESSKVTFQSREKIDRRLIELTAEALEILVGYVAVGTNDDHNINQIIEIANSHENNVEFQMLKGLREDWQSEMGGKYKVGQ